MTMNLTRRGALLLGGAFGLAGAGNAVTAADIFPVVETTEGKYRGTSVGGRPRRLDDGRAFGHGPAQELVVPTLGLDQLIQVHGHSRHLGAPNNTRCRHLRD